MNTHSPDGIGGPIFIVGLARSGTKLLRDILNNHPELFLLPSETNFIPYFVARFGSIESPLGEPERQHFKSHFFSGSFHSGMTERGYETSEAVLEAALREPTWERVFTTLALSYLDDAAPAPRFWGDKTPTHLPHLQMLKREFPDGRFIHIIRDPRDRALSARKAWGANVLLAAEKRRTQVEQARATGLELGADYCEITYESLLEAPAREVSRLCGFLGLPFAEEMLTLRRPTENKRRENTETTSALGIVADNTRKFATQLDAREIARIERIVLPVATDLGYQMTTDPDRFQPLSKTETRFYGALETLQFLREFYRRWGLLKGARHAFERVAMKRANRTS